MALQNHKLIVKISLLAVALFTRGVWSQAPGDEDRLCMIGSYSHEYEAGVISLMDTHNYRYLLGVNEAVWHETDFDDNNNPDSYYQTSWKVNAGGLCRRSIQSCGYREGKQDNWVFTQHISKAAPPGTDIPVKVCVKLTYRVSSCRSRFGCSPVMEVYKYDVDGVVPAPVLYQSTEKFSLVYKHTGTSAISVKDSFCFDVQPNRAGFYLALRDQTSCITLSHMLVYRRQCAEKQVGLVNYPATASDSRSPRTVSATCTQNAKPVTSLEVQCLSTGLWTTGSVPQCRCEPGYREINERGVKICAACPAGTYRSASDSATTCANCPSNTVGDQEGVAECECMAGYYRNTAGLDEACPSRQRGEGPRVACTRPPTKPTNLRLYSKTDTRVSLRWSRPVFTGRRSDLYYSVEYSDPDRVGEFLTPTSRVCLTRTSYDIIGLQPATDYMVRVTAHNGVSDQDLDGAFSRMIDIAARTANAPPSAPVNVRGLCTVVVWGKPQRPNGEIQSYELKFYRSNSPRSFTTRRVTDESTYYVIETDDAPSGFGALLVQVRAINDAGEGSYSDPVPNVCESESPAEDPLQSCPPAPPCDSCCRSCAFCVFPNNDDYYDIVDYDDVDESSLPAQVSNVRALNCTTIVWDRLEQQDRIMIQYHVRVYSGDTYGDTPPSERLVINTFDLWAVPSWLPSGRPVKATVRGRNSVGVSPIWSEPVILTDSTSCPCLK